MNAKRQIKLAYRSLLAVLLFCSFIGQANALEAERSDHPSAESMMRSQYPTLHMIETSPEITPRRWLAQQSQSESAPRIRSQSEVVREVKQRYDAQVLKITLNAQRSAYRVRILLPNGRVREVSVSARR